MEEKLPSREVVQAVARMQQYMLEHIREPITQNKLARAAQYSPFYSAKLFKELMGITPFEYLRRLRLTHSARKLRDEKSRVLDVALEYVASGIHASSGNFRVCAGSGGSTRV